MGSARGNMPGQLAGVSKVMVARYVAPCGHRFTTRASAAAHERSATCWKLPALRTCQSCKFNRVIRDSNGMEHEPAFLETFLTRECTRPNFDPDELTPVRSGVTDLFRDCPGWEFAGAGRRAR